MYARARAKTLSSLAVVVLVMSAMAASTAADDRTGPGSGWTLVWSDEFDGPTGESPDPAKWGYNTGGSGWGNQELQYYTRDRANSALDGRGNLAITARAATPNRSCWYGPCQYTSARLTTYHKFSQAYGRFEARLQLPEGRGLWPAFWLLGEDIYTAGHPKSGEIDVMEYVGHEPHLVHSSLHGPNYDTLDTFSLPHAASFANSFHIFAVNWRPNSITFSVDGHIYGQRERNDAADGWVFDHPFFIILNLAVGGKWPGPPGDATRLPQQMLVDYVRVYRLQ